MKPYEVVIHAESKECGTTVLVKVTLNPILAATSQSASNKATTIVKAKLKGFILGLIITTPL